MRIRHLLVLALLTPAAAAQVESIVGPAVSPPKCPIQVSISNDTATTIWLPNPCVFAVATAGGLPVFAPDFCAAVLVGIPPGETFTTAWDQKDQNGSFVPPGDYVIAVNIAGVGLQLHTVTISTAVDAAVGPRGVPRVGRTRGLFLCAPGDAGLVHLLALSAGTSGIPTCGGVVPLAADPLLTLSLAPNAAFAGFVGFLDANGESDAPAITYPANPSLVGLSFAAAFAVLDPAQPCPVRTISGAAQLKIG